MGLFFAFAGVFAGGPRQTSRLAFSPKHGRSADTDNGYHRLAGIAETGARNRRAAVRLRSPDPHRGIGAKGATPSTGPI